MQALRKPVRDAPCRRSMSKSKVVAAFTIRYLATTQDLLKDNGVQCGNVCDMRGSLILAAC